MPGGDAAAASRPSDEHRRAGVVVLAVVLFAPILIARIAIADPDEMWIAYALPIILLAAELGLRAGLAAALGSSLLVILLVAAGEEQVGDAELISRVAVFFLIGSIVGLYGDRSRAAQAERERARLELAWADAKVEHDEARKRLVAQVLEAEERTRRRLADQIHDHVLQTLISARQDLAEEPTPENLARARLGVATATAILRSMMADLHPILLERAGLETALAAVALHAESAGGFKSSLRVDPTVTSMHDDLIVGLTRELTTNAAKHAQAERLSVSVERHPDRVVLEVADDGRGIPPGRLETALAEGHVGLASFGERVQAVGGALDVLDNPGGGTRVRATLPV